MRIRLYIRAIEIRNGKECLYRDIAVDGIYKDVEAARIKAKKIYNNNIEYDQKYPQYEYLKNKIGINFKIKDLDSKKVIETFEMRY